MSEMDDEPITIKQKAIARMVQEKLTGRPLEPWIKCSSCHEIVAREDFIEHLDEHEFVVIKEVI